MEPRWIIAYHDMLPRLEAEEALLATQIAFLPHYDKQSDRRKVIEKWERETKARPRATDVQHDRQGREIVTDVDEFAAWLRSYGAA